MWRLCCPLPDISISLNSRTYTHIHVHREINTCDEVNIYSRRSRWMTSAWWCVWHASSHFIHYNNLIFKKSVLAALTYKTFRIMSWSGLTGLYAPSVFRSSATRFRWIQNYYGEQDEWALDDIYIGQQCPNMCHGHGWCDHGHCRSVRMHAQYPLMTHDEYTEGRRSATFSSYRCDDGFSGTDCQPSSPLSSSVLSDFESQDALLATWQEVIGGEVVTPDMGCGVVSSGSSLYFSKVEQW